MSVAIAGAGAFIANKNIQISSLKSEIVTLKDQSIRAAAQAKDEVRSTESVLAVDASTTQNQTNEQVQSLTTQRDRLLTRLRIAEANRDRTTTVSSPATASSAPQATGLNNEAELPNQLGEQDVHEAERAETIRLHLAACYVLYDNAAAKLKALVK